MQYGLFGYFGMVSDTVRTNAYVAAIKAAVEPGAVVAEIGTGSGYYAVMACVAGAAKVYAIEYDDVIEVAREVAEENGVADRIEFMKVMSTSLELPAKADVLLSDLRGVLPLFEYHIPSIVDARRRLLAPGGIQIPVRDELYAACVSSARIYRRYSLEPIGDRPHLESVHRRLRSMWSRVRATPSECITGHFHVGTLDYRSIERSDFRAEISWVATEPRTAHGMCIWFDAVLLEGIGFSNAPSESSELIYGQAFFPFAEPVDLDEGDAVSVSFTAVLVRGQYVWGWNTRVTSAKDRSVKAAFRQTSIEGSAVSREERSRRAHDHVPASTQEIELMRFVIERVDGRNSLESIARELAKSYPGRFADWTAALAFAADAVEKVR